VPAMQGVFNWFKGIDPNEVPYYALILDTFYTDEYNQFFILGFAVAPVEVIYTIGSKVYTIGSKLTQSHLNLFK